MPPSGHPAGQTRPVRPESAKDLLAVAEAAQRLGTPVRFVRRLVAERRIRFYKVGRHVRFDATDLDAFIAAGRQEPNHRAS
jgi:excisionase family DNA binding protein